MTLVYEELSGTDFNKVLDTSSSADNNNNYDILINNYSKIHEQTDAPCQTSL